MYSTAPEIKKKMDFNRSRKSDFFNLLKKLPVYGVMVSKLVSLRMSGEFDPRWVSHTFGLVPTSELCLENHYKISNIYSSIYCTLHCKHHLTCLSWFCVSSLSKCIGSHDIVFEGFPIRWHQMILKSIKAVDIQHNHFVQSISLTLYKYVVSPRINFVLTISPDKTNWC